MNHPKLAPAPIPAEVDVKATRQAHPRFHRYLPVTQAAFAELYGFSPRHGAGLGAGGGASLTLSPELC